MREAVRSFLLGNLSKLWDGGHFGMGASLERLTEAPFSTLNPGVRGNNRQRTQQVVNIYWMCFKFLFS